MTPVGRLRLLALAAALAAISASAAFAQADRGHLVVIGGGTRPAAVNMLIARLAGGAKGRLLVFPQASAVAETGPDLATEFRALGVGTVIVISADHAAADSDAVLQQIYGGSGWMA